MAYNITRANGTNFLVLNDNVINRDYSVTFVGKMVPNYGQAINTNFLRLLENSAATTQPGNPVPGQIWYDSSQKRLKFYTGENFHTLDSLPPNTLGTTAYLSSTPLGNYVWVNDKTLKNNLFPSAALGGVPADQINYKGNVLTSADLPTSGAKFGDLYVTSDGNSWVYNGCSPPSATCVNGFQNVGSQVGFLKRNADGSTSYVTAESLISDILPAGRNNQILFNLNKGITSSPNFTWDGTQLIVAGKIYTTGTNNSIAPGAAGSRDLKKYIDDFDYSNADPKGGVLTENQVPLYADFKFSIGGSGQGVFALSLEKNYPTLFFHATTPAGIISPFRAFKFNEQGLWIFDSEPVTVNFATPTERVRAIFNMGTFFAYIQLVNKTTDAETRRVLVKTNNSSKSAAWTLYLDVTTFIGTANLFLYLTPNRTSTATGIESDDRLLTIDLTNPMILKVYSIPVSGTAAPVLLRQQTVLDGATDVSFTDYGGLSRTNSNNYTSLTWGYNAFGVCFPFTWNKFTEQLIFVGVGYGTFSQGTGAGEQGFGATISWIVPRSWIINGTGSPGNIVPVNANSGRRYNYFRDSTWSSATGGMADGYFSAGTAVGIATDENSRYISLAWTYHFGQTTYIYYRKWSAEIKYPVIGGPIPSPVLAENVPIIDESPWSKNLYGGAGFIIGSHATLYVNSAKHGLFTASTDFSSGATARFISQAGTNNAVKLNTLGWEKEYARTAFTSTVLTSPGWTSGDFSFYHTGTTVKSDGTPVYYIARAGRQVFTVSVAGTPWDYGAKKATPQARTYTDAGISVPAMPATIGSITNIVAEPSCFWNGSTAAPVFWHIVRGTNPTVPAGLNATGTPLATNMLYVAKCVGGTWSNIYGPFLIAGIAVGNSSWRRNTNEWSLHNGSHLLTQSGIIMHAGINVSVPGGTSFHYLRFDTNTNTLVSEGGSPLLGPPGPAFGGITNYAGTSYGYSTVLGYYQMSGYGSYIAADIRSSKNMRNAALGTTDPDFTEAQWFAGSGYSIGAICQGQVGLGISIKPFPMLLGGYQINIADTLLSLLPNQNQNIYVRKTPTDRLSNEVYASTEDEPSGFTKQLIATVVTNDEFVTTAIAKPVGVAIPPSDELGTRYLSITAGVCGWVRSSDIVSTGGGSYTLPIASASVLGGVKVDGSTININSTTGVISAASTGVGLGVGQTWQDFTLTTGANERLMGTVYTNTTGKPIMVMINVEGYRVTGSFTIGAITKPITNIDWTQPYTFVVPDNTTYSFNLGGKSGTFWWIELR